jgi:hypothetical protein
MKESIETLVVILKQILDNPFPTDGYGRSLYTADYKKGRLSAWLTVADYLEPFLDAETREKVKRLQRALNGSGYLLDRHSPLSPQEQVIEPTFRLGPS